MYTKLTFTRINKNLMKVDIKKLHPEVIAFLSQRKTVMTKSGYVFEKGHRLQLHPNGDKAIGKIVGLTNMSPGGTLFHRSEIPEEIDHAKHDLFTAISELTYVVKTQNYGSGAGNFPRLLVRKNSVTGTGFTTEELDTLIKGSIYVSRGP